MKKHAIGFILIIIALSLVIIQAIAAIRKNYDWSKNYGSYWSLADKSSSLPAKSNYVAEFIEKLESGDFAEHDAAVFPTPDNSFKENLNAVKTLLQRLKEIEGMDPQSFQYNTAIQQITAQEQGEAGKMLTVLRGCFVKENYPIIWDWWALLYTLGACAILFIGFVLGFS